MDAFDYFAPDNLSEALTLLATPNKTSRPLAGGTDLIVQLRETGLKCDQVIDLKNLAELTQFQSEGGKGWTIGAAVPCSEIYENAEFASQYPGIIDAASLIGGIQIQNRASFGGNLCNASPAADAIPALIAHSVTCQVASKSGTREVNVEDFCQSPGKTVLSEGEILVSLKLPATPKRFGAAYQRFIPRNEMDIAVAGAGSSVVLSEDGKTIESLRVGLGAVAPTPLLVQEISDKLKGKEVDSATFEQAAEIARSYANPISDTRGEDWQRVHLAGVLTQRTLQIACERAQAAL